MAALSSLTPDIADRRYPVFNFQLTSSWMNDFFQVSTYKQELVEQKQKLPRTVVLCLRDAEFYLLKQLKIELDQLLHTTHKYEYFEDIYLDDWLQTEAGIKKVSHRKTADGAVVILEMFNNYYREGVLVSRSSGTVFVREEVK